MFLLNMFSALKGKGTFILVVLLVLVLGLCGTLYYRGEMKDAAAEAKVLAKDNETLMNTVANQKIELDNLTKQRDIDSKALENAAKRDQASAVALQSLSAQLEAAAKKDGAHYNAVVPQSEWDIIFAPLREKQKQPVK